MSEISKEAMDKACAMRREIDPGIYTIDPEPVATALQELMDERDAWERRCTEMKGNAPALLQRAEAAERWARRWKDKAGRERVSRIVYSEMCDDLNGFRMEAELAERNAEAKLAKLVQGVREWREDKAAGWRQLDTILAEYGLDPHGKEPKL